MKKNFDYFSKTGSVLLAGCPRWLKGENVLMDFPVPTRMDFEKIEIDFRF